MRTIRETLRDDVEGSRVRGTCIVCGTRLTGCQRIYCSDSCDSTFWRRSENEDPGAKIRRHRKAAEYSRNHPQAHLEAHKRYLLTAKGQLWIERHKDTWRGRAAFLISVQKPCTKCGETNPLKLECDHIIPRALGGSDDWPNLQVLCEQCHDEKSCTDLVAIRETSSYAACA